MRAGEEGTLAALVAIAVVLVAVAVIVFSVTVFTGGRR